MSYYNHGEVIMNHKTLLSNEEKNQKIQLLRKQRDGLIIGSYRNILADLFVKIKDIINRNENECLLNTLQEKCFAKDDHEKNIIIDYCLDLEQLGYIRIESDRRIIIIKEIDF